MKLDLSEMIRKSEIYVTVTAVFGAVACLEYDSGWFMLYSNYQGLRPQSYGPLL